MSVTVPEARLLVIVIGGGTAKGYDFYRFFWSQISLHGRPFGIHVYTVWYDVNAHGPVYNADRGTLIMPGTNSLIPGCLKSTLEAVEHIRKFLLPGHNATYFLRTNLSTFWKIHMLIPYINRPEMRKEWLYAGLQYHTIHDHFIPGGYLFLNHNTLGFLLANQTELDLTVIDDISIGRFMSQHRIPITYNLEVCIIEDVPRLNLVLEKRQCLESFVFRIRTNDTLADVHLWLRLMEDYYKL